MNGLSIQACTPLVQLQDSGRFGVRHLGITQGGALDWIAQHWANWLLGNPLNAAVLEIPLGGVRLLCQQPVQLALAGADLAARIDDKPLAPWRSFTLRAGEHLSFERPVEGACAYLAAPGGFSAPAVFGSCASIGRESLGGLDGYGSALNVGDTLSWTGGAPSQRELPASLCPRYHGALRLDVVLGAQNGDFAGQSLFDVFNAPWTLDARSNRMGARLLGPVLRYLGRPLVSEGIPLGAIQVPPDGQPIILLNDRQTIGGYPRLGALTPSAVARLAQCLPGETLHLRPVDRDSAQRQHLAQWQHWG
ncbi:MAG: putative protein YbgK [Pseudomonas citronellolis]|nr:MAG: putative protein YbgK [Pseudomonas citronellolis]